MGKANGVVARMARVIVMMGAILKIKSMGLGTSSGSLAIHTLAAIKWMSGADTG